MGTLDEFAAAEDAQVLELEQRIIELKLRGVPATSIAKVLNIPHTTVETKYTKWRRACALDLSHNRDNHRAEVIAKLERSAADASLVAADKNLAPAIRVQAMRAEVQALRAVAAVAGYTDSFDVNISLPNLAREIEELRSYVDTPITREAIEATSTEVGNASD